MMIGFETQGYILDAMFKALLSPDVPNPINDLELRLPRLIGTANPFMRGARYRVTIEQVEP